jgi:PBS lyase HEAT-like repeat
MQLWGDDSLTNYSIAWALGNCGDRSAIPLLEAVYRQANTPAHIRRIALEALFKLNPTQAATLKTELMVKLPKPLRGLIQQSATSTVIMEAVQTYLATATGAQFDVLDLLYQIDNESTRPVILEIVRQAPFQPNYFQRLRHIFKIAEYRQDAEVFATLAYRFERTRALYYSSGYASHIPNTNEYLRLQNWGYDSQTGRYQSTPAQEFAIEMARSNCRLAYSSKTRTYLRKRVWRTLKTLGESAAKLVIEVLTRQSVSIAIGDKARALATLLKIHQLYPQLAVPISVKPLPVKGGRL